MSYAQDSLVADFIRRLKAQHDKCQASRRRMAAVAKRLKIRTSL